MRIFRWTHNHRIHKNKDFIFLREKSKKFYSRHFKILFYGVERDSPPVRLAVVVRKKVGKAVKRNRIRRIVKEFFRLNQFKLPGGDYIVIVRKMPEILKYNSVAEELTEAINVNIKKSDESNR
jgi:ribonuclease P protein component